jgi:uncharacterized protein YlzI (FlbEa/FlbD family)
MLNCDLIETIEPPFDAAQGDTSGAGDTIVTLTTGNAVVVRESMDEIERRIVAFKRKLNARRSDA